MKSFDIPQNFITVLAALILALTMMAVPNASAFAEDLSTTDVTVQKAAPQNPALLRRLLASPDLSTEQQRELENAMDEIYEELADASDVQGQDKSFVQSVNELLGIKPRQVRG